MNNIRETYVHFFKWAVFNAEKVNDATGNVRNKQMMDPFYFAVFFNMPPNGTLLWVNSMFYPSWDDPLDFLFLPGDPTANYPMF